MITFFSLIANSHAEFDLRTISEGSSAAVRYANNSNYRNDSLIRKESEQEQTYQKEERTRADGVIVCVSDALVEEVKRIIKDSEILKYALGLPDKKNTGADLI
jgi:protein mago nashi